MNAFLLAIALFLFGFVVHLAIWRTSLPRATAQVLIVVMVISITIGALALWLTGQIWSGLEDWLPATGGEWTQAVCGAFAYAAVYVMTYPPLEVESPTLVMIELIAGAEPVGMTRRELYSRLDDEFLVVPRIEDLIREGLAIESDGRCRLTRRGLRLEQAFSTWRRILGAGIGG